MSARLAAAVVLVLGVLAGLAGPAEARFRMPDEVPVDRLIANVEAYLEAHPADLEGRYTLARLHSLAVARQSSILQVYGEGGPQELPEVDHPFPDKQLGERPDTEALVGHLERALTLFEGLIGHSPENALYHLGRAYTLEAGADLAHRVELPGAAHAELDEAAQERAKALIDDLLYGDEPTSNAALGGLRAMGPGVLPWLDRVETDQPEYVERLRHAMRAVWLEQAIAGYYVAWRHGINEDLKIEHLPLRGLPSLVAYEAGEAWLRLVKRRGPREAERDAMRDVQASLTALENKPHGPITPIVLSLEGVASIDALLAPDVEVRFDLDGDGHAEPRPWVAADTALLVWDPARTGRVDSGRQLLGSVTWWMFFSDGYRALDALDDDRDGRLRGEELAGLALWIDRDQDAVADDGEVTPIEATPVRSLATRPTGRDGGHPTADDGVELEGGVRLPTWDWTLR